MPVTVIDPGPDGLVGSADDGATVTAYDLTAASVSAPPVNLTTNLPDSNSDYYTWEITATKRHTGRWSLLASFTHTWNYEAALGTGNDFTPNALINSTDHHDRFRTWQAKVNGTMNLPLGFRVVPVLRHQSGTPFARTFVQTFNYGSATLKAEAIAANRTPNITLFDLRTGEGLPGEGCACHGIRRRVQHSEHECRSDPDDQFWRFLATTHSDHRAARAPDRRASGMVTAGTRTDRS